MHLDRRLIGWGLFFILLGGVPLLLRAGALPEDLVGRWPTLWPLILIAWGVGMILHRTPVNWLGGAILAVTLGLMGGGAIATGFSGFSGFSGCGSDGQGSPFPNQSGTLAAGGQVIVEFSCGTLDVTAAAGESWSVSGTASEGRPPEVNTTGSRVELRTDEPSGFFALAGANHWQVSVPQSGPVGLGVTLNAGDGNVDLGGADLSSVNFTVNAGRLDFALGSASLDSVNGTVNAGSAVLDLPGGDLRANLSLNAGSIDVCLPTGTAVRVQWSGALGSNDLDDAGLEKVGENTWQTAGFDAGQPHASMNVSANAGSFGLQFGGTCGA